MATEQNVVKMNIVLNQTFSVPKYMVNSNFAAQRNAVHWFSLFLVIVTWLCVFQPVYRTYRSPPCSSASFFIKLINILRYFLPVLAIFFTQGLWKKSGTFREIPKISFDGDFVVFAFSSEKSIIASSYSVLNSAASTDQLSTAHVSHFFENLENDAKQLNIDFEMTTQNISINSLIYAFIFKFNLDYNSIVEAETLLTDSLQFSASPSEIRTSSRLDVDQSVPFKSHEKWKIIDRHRQDVSHFQIHSILQRETIVPMSLTMNRKSSIIISSPSITPKLSLSLHLTISEIEFQYKTDFWEMMKWAWIQYFAFYVIFNTILTSIISYLFRNRVFYVTDSINSK